MFFSWPILLLMLFFAVWFVWILLMKSVFHPQWNWHSLHTLQCHVFKSWKGKKGSKTCILVPASLPSPNMHLVFFCTKSSSLFSAQSLSSIDKFSQWLLWGAQKNKWSVKSFTERSQCKVPVLCRSFVLLLLCWISLLCFLLAWVCNIDV